MLVPLQKKYVMTYSLSIAIVVSNKNNYLEHNLQAMDFWCYYGISETKTQIISIVKEWQCYLWLLQFFYKQFHHYPTSC